MNLIPAIDIFDGKLVRLNQGEYSQTKQYGLNPIVVAKQFEDVGITNLHLVDLEGAKSGAPKNLNILESISSSTNLIIDFGGGVKSTTSLISSFNAGASQITCGSIAATNKELTLQWLKKYGSDKLILGADCRDEKIATRGWLNTTNLDVKEYISSYLKDGFKRVICTDISKDGMLEGPSFDLYSSLISLFSSSLELVASGGVSCVDDLYKLNEMNLHSVIIGKAYYEGRISLKVLGRLQEAFNAS